LNELKDDTKLKTYRERGAMIVAKTNGQWYGDKVTIGWTFADDFIEYRRQSIAS
jgi:hypothetical protein